MFFFASLVGVCWFWLLLPFVETCLLSPTGSYQHCAPLDTSKAFSTLQRKVKPELFKQ